MSMHCSSMTGTFLLALLATWSLLAQLGSGQRIMNLRNHNLDGTFPRDLRSGTDGDDFTYLRVRQLGLDEDQRDSNRDNVDLEYTAFIEQVRSMLGVESNLSDPGGVERTYRQLVRDVPASRSNYIYIPYASRIDSGIVTAPTNDYGVELELDEAERGFILRRDNLYFVAARVGNVFTSFGKTSVDGAGVESALRSALTAMTGDGPAQISAGWTLRPSGSIGLAYGELGMISRLGISAGCINAQFENLLGYASQATLTAGALSGFVGPATARSDKEVRVGVMTAAVVISEALRLPAVEDRIRLALAGPYLGNIKLSYGARARSGAQGGTLASVLPLQWSRLSSAVRLGQATTFDVAPLSVVDEKGADITEISPYVNVAVLTAVNPNNG